VRIASTDGQTVISDNGQEYHSDAAGMFDVPDALGQQLVKFPMWVAEKDAPAAEHVGKHEAPSHEGRIAQLEAHVAALIATVADLTPKTRRAAKAADADPPAE
jgi:hypothetical protein